MDDSDPLDTNQYISDLSTNAGYGMSEEQRKFTLRQHIEQQSKIKNDENQTINDDVNVLDVYEDDLLKTNPVVRLAGSADNTDNFKDNTDNVLKNSNMMYVHTSHGPVPNLQSDYNRVTKEKRNVLSVNSIHRQLTELILIPPNSETGLYTRYDSMGNLELYDATILNNEYVPGSNDVPRPYVTINGLIYQQIYKYPDPNYYEFTLPKVYNNIKSIRLISSEFPNTLGVINNLNNICILDIQSNSTISIINLLSLEVSPFSFIVFQLDPGYYTLIDLAIHLQSKLNIAVSRFINPALGITFIVDFDQNTGKSRIIMSNTSYKFHLKFWFINDIFNGNIPISEYDNLWYKLGFQYPYDVNTDGSDKYVQERNNLFDHGVNPLFSNDNAPTDYSYQNSIIVPSSNTDYHLIIPYRYPDLQPNHYIYMLIQGMETVVDVGTTNSTTVNFKNEKIFAKIVLNVPVGNIAYNSYVDSPMIYFETPLPKLLKLKFKFVDFAGTPVDFQSRNHSFTLEIIEYIDQLNTNHYSSYRGTIDRTAYSDAVKYRET